MPTEEETIRWTAEFQDNLTAQLKKVRQSAEEDWLAVGRSFQAGADESTIASEAIQQSAASVEHIFESLSSSEGLLTGEGLSAAKQLLSALGALELTGLEDTAFDFSAIRESVEELRTALGQLQESALDPTQLVQLGKILGGVADQLKGIPLAEIAIQVAGPVSGMTGDAIVGFLVPAIEKALVTVSQQTGKWISRILSGALKLATASVGKEPTEFFANVLRGAVESAEHFGGDLVQQSIQRGARHVADQVEQAGEEIADSTSAVIDLVEDKFLDRMRTGARSMVDSAQDMVKDLWTLVPSFAQIGAGITGWFSELQDQITARNIRGVAKRSLGALSPEQLIIDAIQKIIRPITDMALDLFDALVAPFEALTATLSTTLVPVFRIFQAILTPVARVLSAIIQPLTEFITAFLEPIAQIIETVMNLVGPLLEAATTLVTGPLRLITLLLTPLARALEWFSDLLQPAADWLEGLSSSMEDFFSFGWLLDIMPGWAKSLLGIGDTEGAEDATVSSSGYQEAETSRAIVQMEEPSQSWYEQSPEPEYPGRSPRPAQPPEPPEWPEFPGVFGGLGSLFSKIFGDDKGERLTKKDQRELLDDQTDSIVAAIRRTELDPDDWFRENPVVVRLASFRRA